MCTKPGQYVRSAHPVAASRHEGQRGISLVEQIVFIIVVSVGVVGVLSTMSAALRFGAEPMVRKQLVAVAESLLNEILQQPFTYCDPDDVAALSATSTADCSGGAAASQDKGGAALTSSSPAGESRTGTGPGSQFDNVADYGGYTVSPVTDATGANPVAGFTASVAIERVGTTFGLADNAAALRVTVTATQGSETVALSGYRFRYAPRY